MDARVPRDSECARPARHLRGGNFGREDATGDHRPATDVNATVKHGRNIGKARLISQKGRCHSLKDWPIQASECTGGYTKVSAQRFAR